MEAVKAINESKPCVFLSYNVKDRTDEAIGELLQGLRSTLQEEGFDIVDDKRILNYNGSIYDFMEKEGFGKYIILVLSENYLKSRHCMLELNEIVRSTEKYSSRFFPLIANNVNIFSADARAKYIAYWNNEIKRLEESLAAGGESPENNKLLFDLSKFSSFKNDLHHILQFLSSVNTITFCDDNADLIKQVSKSLEIKTLLDSAQTRLQVHEQ